MCFCVLCFLLCRDDHITLIGVIIPHLLRRMLCIFFFFLIISFKVLIFEDATAQQQTDPRAPGLPSLPYCVCVTHMQTLLFSRPESVGGGCTFEALVCLNNFRIFRNAFFFKASGSGFSWPFVFGINYGMIWLG